MLALRFTAGSPNESRDVIGRYTNNNGFICIRVRI